MITTTTLCVILFSCAPFTKPKIRHPECSDNSYSLSITEKNSQTVYNQVCNEQSDIDIMRKLKQDIDTLLFNEIDFNLLSDNYLNGLSVNNLVFIEGGIIENTPQNPDNSIKIFSGLNVKKLILIKFINVKLQIGLSGFSWKTLESFNELQAFHIEGGYLDHINYDFGLIPGGKILIATFDNSKLKTIDKNVFSSWKSLRMLTVIRNLIEDLDWMPSDLNDLWYLDLRRNNLKTFPQKLAEDLKGLKVLKLGENRIRVINEVTINLLLRLKEFSFDKMPESGDTKSVSESDYFRATKEMLWTINYNSILNHNFPYFFNNSIRLKKCQRYNERINLVNCVSLNDEQFDAENSDHIIVKDDQFSIENRRVFLSGANLPYYDLGYDFGDDFYIKSKTNLEGWLSEIEKAGGNSVRILLDYNSKYITPLNWKNTNHKQTPNKALIESRIRDLKLFLKFAQTNNIFVIICLWSADSSLLPLIQDDDRFNEFINEDLKPMVKELSKYKSLVGFDIINEPANLIRPGVRHENPCFDTSKSAVSPDDSQTNIELIKILRFISLQASVIHSFTPKKLVTVGMNEKLSYLGDCVECFDILRDKCLRDASNKQDGILDFYQIHINTNTKPNFEIELMPVFSPINYMKPFIIGKIVTQPNIENARLNFGLAIDFSYAGIFGWKYNGDLHVDGEDNDKLIINEGLKELKDENAVAITINE